MRSRFISLLVVLAFTAFPVVVSADAPENIGHVLISSSSIDWLGSVAHDELTLTVQMPDGTNFSKSFNSAAAARLSVNDIPRPLQDGVYHYDLRLTPRIAAGVRQALANARAQNNDAAIKQIKNDNGLNQEVVQSGVFSISNGSFVSSTIQEQRSSGTVAAASVMRPAQSDSGAGSDDSGTYSILANRKLQPKVTDVVTADDAIIQGSLCVGLDCVNNESFGFDTVRLKENNTRIKFDDTSTSAGFPNNDWQLTANDSASGGANKFSIDDVTGSKTPFTITAGAPTNSTFVASTGKVGFRNSAPGLDLHITTGDTPAIRQEQTNASGFTAQTWDIGANEANWFVRDVTGGSRLPLRIRPGAPTSSVDIAATGFVGVGTAAPALPLDVQTTTAGSGVIRVRNSSATGGSNIEYLDNLGTIRLTFGMDNASVTNKMNSLSSTPIVMQVNSTERMRVNTTGVTVTGDFTVTGGTKNFAMVDPSDSSKAIYYAALEGPEAGTYFRGTAKTVNGEAVITLPGYFARITESENITVQLTPSGKWGQLFVATKSPEQLVIKVASGDDVEFDYFVQGVRKGYSNFKVERERTFPISNP